MAPRWPLELDSREKSSVIGRILDALRRHTLAALALFLVLGGSAYAGVTLGPESVGSREIANHSVETEDLARGAVTTMKIEPNAVTPSRIAPSAVNSDDVEDGSLTLADLKRGQVPQGPAGERGAQGTAGQSGPKGDSGATGPHGGTGSTGMTGGTGRTAEDGEDGSPGPPGQQGPQGERRAAGPARDERRRPGVRDRRVGHGVRRETATSSAAARQSSADVPHHEQRHRATLYHWPGGNLTMTLARGLLGDRKRAEREHLRRRQRLGDRFHDGLDQRHSGDRRQPPTRNSASAAIAWCRSRPICSNSSSRCSRSSRAAIVAQGSAHDLRSDRADPPAGSSDLARNVGSRPMGRRTGKWAQRFCRWRAPSVTSSPASTSMSSVPGRNCRISIPPRLTSAASRTPQRTNARIAVTR